MRILLTWIWLVQFFVFSGLGLVCLFAPDSWTFATSLRGHDLHYVQGYMRMSAPIAILLALFSSYAAMREDIDQRRDASLVFGAFYVCGIFASYHDLHAAWAGPSIRAIFGVFGMVNLLYALPKLTLRRSRRGVADTTPPALWALWYLQAFGLTAAATLVLAWPEAVVAGLAGRNVTEAAYGYAATVLHGSGVLWIGVTGWSYLATRARREWHWREFRRVFLFGSAAWVLTALFAWGASGNTLLLSLSVIPVLLVGLANAVAGQQREGWVAEDIGEGPDGWTITELVSGPILVLQSMSKRRRATHLYGVAANGRFEVKQDERVPPNEFFRDGDTHPLQARFANVTFADDCANDVRGCAIRLSQSERSPFDMLLNTGAYAASHNIVHFTIVLFTKSIGTWARRILARNDIQGREGGVAAMRRSIPCYSEIRYYSQTVRYWNSKQDGITRYLVRYRVVPVGDAPEPGLMTERDNIFERERYPEEKRPSDFTRREFSRRLEAAGEVRLLFQASFHRPQPGDGLQWFDATLDWDQRVHPWLTIGTIVLTEPLSAEACERLRFNSANHPPSLGVPVSSGVLDPRSMADSEKRIIARLQKFRTWMYDSLGLPREPEVRT